MKFKQLIILLLFILMVCPFSACKTRNKEPALMNKLKVITTLFPLYDIAKNIGADKVDISLLLPPGMEAHSFEPKPSDIVKINKADVFVYTGKFMEPWAEDVIKA
jgi:zinc transport system substrate-binding protein